MLTENWNVYKNYLRKSTDCDWRQTGTNSEMNLKIDDLPSFHLLLFHYLNSSSYVGKVIKLREEMS